jgi:type II secretory pathway component GspD/PulD (secretin)
VSNIQYQDVSLRLDVSPLIMSDNELMLQIKQVNASVAGNTTISGNPIPNISNQGLETTIMVKDGATIMLGGLISETTERVRNGIPILKDIPIIKYLTSSTRNDKNRRELLVFIQPRIVSGTGDEPTSPGSAPGATPMGDEMRRFIKDERTNPEEPKTEVKRSRAARLFQRFFQ